MAKTTHKWLRVNEPKENYISVKLNVMFLVEPNNLWVQFSRLQHANQFIVNGHSTDRTILVVVYLNSCKRVIWCIDMIHDA